MDFNAIFKAFTDNPTVAVAVLSILANVYQYREAQKGHASTLETALSINTTAYKLAEGVEALDRMEARREH